MHFSEWYSRLTVKVALPLSAGKTTIDASGCNFSQRSVLILGELICKKFEILKCKVFLAQIISVSSFLRSFTAPFKMVVISLFGNIFDAVEKLSHFTRRLDSI